jgi:hypothetical protein
MATSNPYGSGRFKINVNRVKSKKWKDADKVDYGGGWGDDSSDDGYDQPAPVSADNPRHPAWNAPPNAYPSNRSVTNPSPSRAGQRPSFDRGDERRHFSSAGNFDSPYPTTQRSPFAEPQHDDPPPMPQYGVQPPLRLNTQGPMPPGMPRPGSRGRQYPPREDVPYSAPGGYPQPRRSGSSNRPQADSYQFHEHHPRPDSRSSNASHSQFPPRKQSLSQQTPAPELGQSSHSPAMSHASTTVSAGIRDDRPPPVIIRPADIYKRMNEEMEKARKSQESSARASMDSDPNRARDPSVGARSTSSDPKESAANAQGSAEDPEAMRRLKPTLDPVPERKSEYGFDNLLKTTNQESIQTADPKSEQTGAGVSRHGTNASSVYTDRPDPVSASSLSRNVSLTDDMLPSPSQTRTNFGGLPPIGRMSGFGVDLPLSDNEPSQPVVGASRTSRDGSPETSSTGASVPQRELEVDPGLRHQPTMGYTSVVQQAFEDSQQPTPLAHSLTSSTIDRSNSASTSEISPIMARTSHPEPNSAFTVPVPPISEEGHPNSVRPTSTSTLRPTETNAPREREVSPPAGFRPGYRRDLTPPSRDNSPAKKPRESEPGKIAQPQQGSLVDDEDDAQAPVRGRTSSLKDKPLPAQPHAEVAMRNFNAPSPVLRSESPPKGTVRGLADKLESSSGRSSPINSGSQIPLPGLAQMRPSAQTRMDSFRPAIPGGWQSYTSSAGPSTPGTNSPGVSAQRPRFAQMQADSTESIPTAHAPADMGSQEGGITQKAFAAAASAGSALAGALAGQRLTERDRESPQRQSEEEAESDNEWDQSSSSGPEDAAESTEAPGIQSTAQHIDQSTFTPTVSTLVPPSTDSDRAQSVEASSEGDATTSSVDYFPAPLRTSRSIDPSAIRPPIPNVVVPVETPPESENERLQEEIEKSLTPKSSNLAEGPAQQAIPVTGTEANAHEIRSPQSVPGQQWQADPEQTVSLAMTEPSRVGEPGLSNNEAASRREEDNIREDSRSTAPKLETGFAAAGLAQAGSQQEAAVTGRPFLQQRFSWETGSTPPASVTTPHQTSPPSGSPDTIRPPLPPAATPSDATTTKQEEQPTPRPPTAISQPPIRSEQISTGMAPQQPLQSSNAALSPQTNISPQKSNFTLVSPQQTTQSQRPFSGEPPSFRNILNLGSPSERIKAFDASRQFYAAPNEQLQGWLMAMKSPEHSELFASNGRLSSDITEHANSHKPSPRRILTDSAGARHMQEDGKKLMAAAGRFSGKAGNAAKGLFAKGKEKMRNASSGEKVAR